MNENGDSRLKIGEFDFDCQAVKLFRDGQPVKIQPQPLRVFQLLIERRGEIVSREELHHHIWNGATFVEFDQGLNYCIRHIRQVLGDNALSPTYIETLPKQGYRLIAGASKSNNPVPGKRRVWWPTAAVVCVGFALVGVAVYFSVRPHTVGVQYTQLTDFAESAVSPALSPDGHMLAFYRSEEWFQSTDQIWVKMLPNGESKRLTNDRHWKYGLTFSPDGSEVYFSALEGKCFSTYAVSVLGGEPHLVLANAAGFSHITAEKVLFSRAKLGLHMGLVMGTLTGQDVHDVYVPPNEGAMVHYAFASPDRKTAITLERDEQGHWVPCRIVSLDNSFLPRQAGPAGACTSAAWSPDGWWMYFTADVKGSHHIWRQRYPNGEPQQITFGPASEDGLALEPGGHSLITSLGLRENSILVHDRDGARPLTTEGEILGWQIGEDYGPLFTADGRYIYYLARARAGLPPELWHAQVKSGKPEAVLPGIPMLTYDVSLDGKQVLYSNSASNGIPQIGVADMDNSSPPKRISVPGLFRPYFGLKAKIIFLQTDQNINYLKEMNQDGSGRRKVLPFPIVDILGISPARRWLFIWKGAKDSNDIVAISLKGDPPKTLCAFPCYCSWSPNGKWLYVPVVHASGNDPGRSLAIPIGPDETLPSLPAGGIQLNSQASIIHGAQSINREWIVPGPGPSQYAYLKGGVHRNLYRVSLP